LYNLQNLKHSEIINKEYEYPITAIQFNHKGNWLVTGNTRGDIFVWNAATYVKMDDLEGHKSRIYDIGFNPDDNIMATSSLDGTVRLWDCKNLNNQPIELTDHESWVLSIAFSPDGRHLVTSSNQKERLLVWPVKPELMASNIKSNLSRNLTREEWETYVAKDIPYEKTINEN